MGKVSLGGKTQEQAISALQFLRADDPEIAIKENSTNQIYKIKASDIALYYDTEDILKTAVAVGRSGNFIRDSIIKISLIFKKTLVEPTFFYNPDLLKDQIENIKNKFNSPSHNAYFYILNNDIAIEKEQTGKKLDDGKLKSLILKSFLSLNFPVIDAPMENFNPQIGIADLTPLQGQARSIVFSNPVLTYNKLNFYLKPEDILRALTPKSNGLVKLDFDNAVLEKNLAKITNQIDTKIRGAVVLDPKGIILEFRPITPGRTADSKLLAVMLSKALLAKEIEKEPIQIPVKEIPLLDDPKSYGIRELLGEGKSKFSGSISSRIHNIALASDNIKGALVAPSDTFSFNKSVGDIDAEHGFTSAYIISKGRTVLGEGGGVCQVSTTLFRAVLNSGLAVVSRTAHAYRVGYYEQDSPPGFDATIYQPTVDFKFKNDTEKCILIDTEVDEKNLAMSFKIYGTSDGRKVQITVPEISSQTSPPETAYEQTDTLMVGEKKQVDWSAWGAVVKFGRTVTLDNKILSDDKFSSIYRPWRAVYLVGTKEP